MDLGSVSEQDLGRILCVSADCNPTVLRLSAAEGYLLSRIDEHTPWRLLREIGGLSSDEVDICLENWIADGIVEMRACEQTQRVAPKSEEKKPAIPGVIDESEIDASLEISVEDQHKILEFESGLGRGYAEILGVKSDADTKAIKKAYRKLSREYHPDRYFKKQIAGYAERLDVIFKKVLEAYELLSDPVKQFLEPLEAVHDGAIPYVGAYRTKPPEGGYPRNRHPVITRHPETGRKILYVNSGFTSHIAGLTREESRAILDMLYRHIAMTPRLHCRVEWEPNTLTFWDNRCTQHHAVWDYYPCSRRGERVSIVGDKRPSR